MFITFVNTNFTNMKDRLLKFLNKEGLSATVFADEIGVQRSSISHILSGRNNPSYDFILKILEKFDYINADWLITGKGDMYKSEDRIIRTEQLTDKTLFRNTENRNIGEERNLFSNIGIDNQNRQKESETGKNNMFTNVNNVERIVYFYINGTFKEYKPSE